MATEVLELVIVTRGAGPAAGQINQITRSANVAATALRFLRNALVVFSAIRAFSGITALVDSFTEITTKLKLVTNSTEELTAVTQALFNVSQETRTSFEANVSLFNRVARATTGLNLNYQQLIDTTRTVSQLIKISGATTQESTGALIQFSQALASNRLSGDELRTVLEQLPRLADVIGKEFGISGASLRALANSNPGIITTEKIMRALANAGAETGKEFEKVVPTISDGFTLVNNALTLFIGRVNQAGGIGAFLFEVLAKIAENIDLIVVGLTVLAALTVFNFLASQVVAFATATGTALGVVLRLVNFLTFSIATLTRGLILLGTAFLTNPFFLAATLIVGAIVTAFFVLGGTIEDVTKSFGGLKNAANVVLAGLMTFVEIVFTRFDLLGKAIIEPFVDAFDILGKLLGEFLDFMSRALKTVSFGAIDLGEWDVQINTATNFASGAGAELGKALSESYQKNLALDPVGSLVKFGKDGLAALRKLLTGGQIDNSVLQNKPPAGLPGAELDTGADKRAQLLQQLENFLARISPKFDISSKLLKLRTLFEEALDAGVPVAELFARIGGFPEALKRVEREELGVGNATAYYTERVDLLNDALKRNIINQAEATEALRKNRMEFLESQRDIASGIELAQLKKADTLSNKQAIATDVVGDALKERTALETLTIQVEALNEAKRQGVITNEEFTNSMRESQLAALAGQKDALSGFQRGILLVQKDLADVASKVADIVVGSFKKLEDALTSFVTTGKLDLGDLFNFIYESLIRLAIQQSIIKPLSDFLGAGAGTAGGGVGGGGFDFGALLSSVGSALFGAANGAQFMVGGAGGTDSQLVAFRASPNERVTVETPEQRNRGEATQQNISMTFNINGVTDYDSFQRSEDQIYTRAAARLQRAAARNG
jgi:tape measure domain-containing protein